MLEDGERGGGDEFVVRNGAICGVIERLLVVLSQSIDSM